jgi:hypothetical protein
MGLTVNMSSKEAAAKAFDDIPVGKYNCVITDYSLEECGPNSKNPGENYYRFEFTIQDGKYEGQHLFANAMLFDGALYTISNLMKAVGFAVTEGEMEIPDGEEFVTKPVICRVGMSKAQVGDGTKENPQYPSRPEVKGFFPAGSGTSVAAAQKKGSLLP